MVELQSRRVLDPRTGVLHALEEPAAAVLTSRLGRINLKESLELKEAERELKETWDAGFWFLLN